MWPHCTIQSQAALNSRLKGLVAIAGCMVVTQFIGCIAPLSQQPCTVIDVPSQGVCQGVQQRTVCFIPDRTFTPPIDGFEEMEVSCDGLDNDCDGQVDEGLKNACGLCPGEDLAGCMCPDPRFTGENCDECSGFWQGPDCDVCPPRFAGMNCDACAGNYTGDDCEVCPQQFTGQNCDRCSFRYTGEKCDQCAPQFAGEDCNTCTNFWRGDRCDVCEAQFTGEDCDACSNYWSGPQCGQCLPPHNGPNCDTCINPMLTGAQCDECANYWSGPLCDQCKPPHSGEACDRCENPRQIGDTCSECGPQFAGPDCSQCANFWQGDECDVCAPRFEGQACDRCSNFWSGSFCETCLPQFAGENCDRCTERFEGDLCERCSNFWSGDSCSVCSPQFTGEDCDRCAERFEGENCGQCAHFWRGDQCDVCEEQFTGVDCDRCRGRWVGDNCDVCPPQFTGAECDRCSGFWTGADCDVCEPRFAGDSCDRCADERFRPDACANSSPNDPNRCEDACRELLGRACNRDSDCDALDSCIDGRCQDLSPQAAAGVCASAGDVGVLGHQQPVDLNFGPVRAGAGGQSCGSGGADWLHKAIRFRLSGAANVQVTFWHGRGRFRGANTRGIIRAVCARPDTELTCVNDDFLGSSTGRSRTVRLQMQAGEYTAHIVFPDADASINQFRLRATYDTP